MHESTEVVVLRLGHRPGRDDRMTTHVALTARALGADRAILVGEATQARETAADITDRFGGPFDVTVTDSWRPTLRDWDGMVVHLTMYGEPVESVTDDIRERFAGDNGGDGDGDSLLLVVGAGKVDFEVYDHADWNVGVTNQPHSEVAALAVFLDRLFEGRELNKEWVDPERRVIPQAAGKWVEEVDDG
jgi:tRNA (cytidine56-2'-O)-methyltransferase